MLGLLTCLETYETYKTYETEFLLYYYTRSFISCNFIDPRFKIFCIYIFDQKTVSLFTEEGISRKVYKFISVCYTLFSTLHYGKQLMKQALRSQM